MPDLAITEYDEYETFAQDRKMMGKPMRRKPNCLGSCLASSMTTNS